MSLEPSEKVDVWVFGIFLYQLCSGGNPFHTGYQGDLRGVDAYSQLHHWNKLEADRNIREHIQDPLAQDLLRQILLPINERLPNMMAVLRHPFFSPTSTEAERYLEKVSIILVPISFDAIIWFISCSLLKQLLSFLTHSMKRCNCCVRTLLSLAKSLVPLTECSWTQWRSIHGLRFLLNKLHFLHASLSCHTDFNLINPWIDTSPFQVRNSLLALRESVNVY